VRFLYFWEQFFLRFKDSLRLAPDHFSMKQISEWHAGTQHRNITI